MAHKLRVSMGVEVEFFTISMPGHKITRKIIHPPRAQHEKKPIYGIQAHIERVSDKNTDGWRVLENFFSNVVKR